METFSQYFNEDPGFEFLYRVNSVPIWILKFLHAAPQEVV